MKTTLFVIQDDVKHLYLRLEGWHVKQLDVDRIGWIRIRECVNLVASFVSALENMLKGMSHRNQTYSDLCCHIRFLASESLLHEVCAFSFPVIFGV